jgi:serine/threonine protein kinase
MSARGTPVAISPVVMIEPPGTLSEHEPVSVTCSSRGVRARAAARGAAAPAALAPQTRIGDWLVDSAIGAGGMGNVYAVTHAVIGKRAALKIVRADHLGDSHAADRFVQEARIVNQIGHPNIVDIFQLGWLDERRPFLIMELLVGRTLARRLIDGHPLPQETIGILLQICDALIFAHAHGVVHRDLKPQNVFLVETAAGTVVKVLDWGVAKLMGRSGEADTLTATGALVGTPHYIAPEQARAKEVDGRADVYSLGAISFELFLGRPPFVADNIADLIAMQLREPPPPPRTLWPDIPLALERLLLAMLAKSADDRPGIAEVRQALGEVSEQLELRPPRMTSDAIAMEPGPASAIDRIPTWDMPKPVALALGSATDGRDCAQAEAAPEPEPAPEPTPEPANSDEGRHGASFFRALGALAAEGIRRVVKRRS